VWNEPLSFMATKGEREGTHKLRFGITNTNGKKKNKKLSKGKKHLINTIICKVRA